MPGLDFILKTGDTAIFNPAFGNALVVVAPGTITGSSKVKIDGAIACVARDEASVVVAGASYASPPFVIPGVGTLTISTLGSDQVATKTKSVQKPTILKGLTFTARFTVSLPAAQPNPPGAPNPDPVTMYSGSGQFITTNLRSKGS